MLIPQNNNHFHPFICPSYEMIKIKCNLPNSHPCFHRAQTSSSRSKINGAYAVPSILQMNVSKRAVKVYGVRAEDLRRRCAPPESMAPSALAMFTRKRNGSAHKLVKELAEAGVDVRAKRTALITPFSKICEGNYLTDLLTM